MTHTNVATHLPSNRSSSNLQSAAKKRHSAHARPQRPTPLTRRDTGPKSPAHSRRQSGVSLSGGDDLDIMSGTFLQFCTICEKQIAASNSTILYCSERCRNKDTSQTSTYQLFQKDFSSPPQSPRYSGHFQYSPQQPSTTSSSLPPDGDSEDIIPQRSPTLQSSLSFTSLSFMNYREDMASRLSSSTPRGSMSGPSAPNGPVRRDSEASKYLAQFQQASNTTSDTPRTLPTNPPSLSHTPGSSASIISPVSSWTNQPASGSYFDRPLPRKVPGGSVSSYSAHRSADLVTPMSMEETISASKASEETIVPDFDGLRLRASSPSTCQVSSSVDAVKYEKRKVPSYEARSLGKGERSLKELFEAESRGRKK